MKPIKVHFPRAMIGLLIPLLSGSTFAQEFSTPVLSALAKKRESSQLKAVILEQYPRLAPLQPWQERLWQEEVIPHHLRFIKDYRTLPSGIQAEVDVEGIRNFLKFYAPAPLLKKPENLPRLAVFLDAQTPCERCTQALPQIKDYVATTLESRGLKSSWVSPQELGLEGPLVGEAQPIELRLSQVAQKQKTFGSLVVSWNPAPEEEIDTAHADEKRYWVEIHLSVQGAPRISRKKEILDNESFLLTVNHLMVDVFTDLGAQLENSSFEESDTKEILITVSGKRDYSQYSLMKTQLADALKTYGILQDRFITQKELTFALPTSASLAEVRRIALESKPRWDVTRQFQLSVDLETQSEDAR